MSAQALPSNGQTPAPRTCDASGMAMIHRFFRKHFAEAPDYVRGVAVADVAHAAVIADHLALLSGALHAHHEGEDERLWSTVSTRNPACILHVERMKQHHAQMLDHLHELEVALPAWRADATDAGAVLAALDGVNATLAVHLDDEVENIVPVMETTMTQAEVDWFSEHGRRAAQRGKAWPSLGMIMDAQPDGGAHMLRHGVPAPFRLLWRLAGPRKYAAYKAALSGA